jgi:hypothetical protein
MTDRSAYNSDLNSQRSLQLGGPIIKDRLWFHLGYFDAHPRDVTSIPSDYFFDSVGNITGHSPTSGDPLSYYTGNGYTYQKKIDDYRREIKLTGAITDDHTVSVSYHNQNKYALSDYGAGDPVALTGVVTNSTFWNASLRSIWAPWVITSLRFGAKHQYLGSEGGDTGQWLINNDDTNSYLAYRNTYFNPADPAPDVRDNRTANFKATFFIDWNGSHELDAGLDWYRGNTVASGDGSPTNITGPAGTPVAGRRLNLWWVDAYDVDPVTKTSGVYDAYFGEWVQDRTTNTTLGYYINDKWTLNQNWVLQLGGRFDTYDYKSEAVGKIASNSSFSPRLGVKWDFFGDSSWVAGLSYAKYNGKVLEGTLTNATYVNTPRLFAFNWAGPARANNADLANLANWDFSTTADFSDAGLTNKFDPHLKPQSVTEIQATLTWAFKHPTLGQGFLKGTLVSKDWNNLIDYRSGNDGHVTDPIYSQDFYVRYYYNNPDAKRTYRAMELEGNLTKDRLNLSGYLSLSKLRGNFVGEERANPGKGQGLYNFTNTDGVQMYDPALLNPYGNLPGDVPYRAQVMATYSLSNFLGKQSFGLLQRWVAGARYSTTRSISSSAINPGLPGQFGYHANQYLGERGDGSFPSVATLDFTFQETIDLWPMGKDRHAQGFLKMDIGNLLNHQQQQSYQVGYQSVDSSGSIGDPWVKVDGWGQPTGSADYIDGRTVKLSVGVKF